MKFLASRQAGAFEFCHQHRSTDESDHDLVYRSTSSLCFLEYFTCTCALSAVFLVSFNFYCPSSRLAFLHTSSNRKPSYWSSNCPSKVNARRSDGYAVLPQLGYKHSNKIKPHTRGGPAGNESGQYLARVLK